MANSKQVKNSKGTLTDHQYQEALDALKERGTIANQRFPEDGISVEENCKQAIAFDYRGFMNGYFGDSEDEKDES